MLVEVLLEFLISKVDVELFKPIHFKVFKPKNVEYSNEGEFILPSSDSNVDPLQNPSEQVGIDTHGSGVSRIFSLENTISV